MESPLVVLSTAYFPPIQFFSKVKDASSVLLEQHETYPKQTYRNRCEIASANGKLSLSIPVIKPNGNRTRINEVIIDYSDPWHIKHWRTIESAYRRSAYFELLEPEFAALFQTKWTTLWDFNRATIDMSFDILNLKVSCEGTHNFVKKYPSDNQDFRYVISPKNDCSSDLYFKPKNYYQVFQDKFGFLPNLSVLDLIFNCGPEGIDFL